MKQQNKNSKTSKISKLILDLLSDEKMHTTKEIMDIAVEKGIIPDKNTDIVYNILFHMKKKGMITSGPEKGQYILDNVGGNDVGRVKKEMIEQKVVKDKKREDEGKVSILNLDKDKYSLLRPLPARYSKMILTVKENGELKMNGVLMNNIKERNVEIFISKDLRTVILNPSGACVHKFTKAGTAKNREIVLMLRKLRIKFPIAYVVNWNDSIGAWEGKLDISEKD